MSVTVKNGERRSVSISGKRGAYEGPAAVEGNGPWRLCFPGSAGAFRVDDTGAIGETEVRVTEAEQSGLVPALVILTVTAVTPG